MKTKFVFSFTVLALFLLFVIVTGVVGDVKQKVQKKKIWCLRPLPDQKPGKCVIKDCESKCKEKWKGNGTEASCRPQCNCHFRCPWLQGQA
ncbi:PREDICTED: putative defensin-like protein 145 [Camelina sativa]|uniref:Defensin-like protein 145 n=1 Tax=Camelina sativa TaxID=90675 RepID=A0ABM1QNS6_CAMSA|nr:PREDICTED: putative defensin-like protein 145 [Camelina sativa]